MYVYEHLTVLLHGSYRPERKSEQLCVETLMCDEETNSSVCNTDLLYCAVGLYMKKQVS
jgi:predicted nucleic-acid-binding protein